MTLTHDDLGAGRAPALPEPAPHGPAAPRSGHTRRRFLGYLLAGTTLAVGVDLGRGASRAEASVPSPPQVPELYDLEDLETQSALPTSALIRITVDTAGVAHFEMPRMEVGQGITTAAAMIIAEELGVAVSAVDVTLAPARPELAFNQLTGGSNTMNSMFTPIRVAAAIAKGALLRAAAIELGSVVATLVAKDGVVSAPGGRTTTYGALSAKAASDTTRPVSVDLKDPSAFTVVGRPQNRVDAMDIVTGRKRFTMDLSVPDALPTMVCRPPTLNGSPRRILNLAAVQAMPGVTDVALVDTGVAVRAQTFGQCIDAVRALQCDWNPGSVEGQSDDTVLATLKKAELPMAVPSVPILAQQLDLRFEFMFRSSAALEPNCAIADVRSDRATVWAGLKSPIVSQAKIADALGLPQTAVTVNVVTGGGSFGHKLFGDGALEAAKISKAMGKPVKLMWHRCDEPREGRTHPMATSRIRATVLAGQVLSFEQRHTSVKTDFGHGLGERITAMAAQLPANLGGLSLSAEHLHPDPGAALRLRRRHAAAQRGGPAVQHRQHAQHLLTRRRRGERAGRRPAGADDGQGPARLPARLPQGRPHPGRSAEGRAGRRLGPQHAGRHGAGHRDPQGVQGRARAVLVEIDCRPATVNRPIRDGVTGPRVTKAVVVVDVGLVVNPTGLEAQMMGGVNDGIALALTSSNHLQDGHFLEGSWDNYFYTRQWNIPPDVPVRRHAEQRRPPGGAGEAGVPATVAATACAYARATGTVPTRFPVNHGTLSFTPKSFVPPIPQSPTDGLSHTY